MKKLLAVLGSIGLTSTAASAVVACGNTGGKSSVRDREFVVNPDVVNGSYEADSQTFTSTYGSDKYETNKLSFSLTKVVLDAKNILVTTAGGKNIDQTSKLWSFTVENGNTVFTIQNTSLNGATVQINLNGYLPTTFTIVIPQDSDFVISNVVNGSYNTNNKTLTADYDSSKYNEHNMRFSLANVSLKEDNFVVTQSNGTKVSLSDGWWSFIVNDNTTTFHLDDYHLNGATIQIKDVEGYNPITFKVVIEQDQDIVVSDSVTNGSYDTNTKTFTSEYGSSQYNDHKMSFTINSLALSLNNIVVKNSNGETKPSGQGWDLTINGNNTTITINDYNLNQGTITIQDVDGYWPVTFKLVISQDANFVISNVVNGSYDDSTNTIMAIYGNSKYPNNNMSFDLTNVVLDVNNVVITKADGTSGNDSGLWTLNVNGNITTITIKDASLNGALIQIKDVDGYWPVTFMIAINQDQEVIVDANVDNGSYDTSTKTFNAEYGSSEYSDEQHMLTFSLKDINLTEDNIIVKNSDGKTIALNTGGWNLWISDDQANTVFRIRDSSLNNATITIQDATGYWPVTFKVMINQDIQFTFDQTNVVNGSYDTASHTITADAKDSDYANKKVAITFNNLTLSETNLVVKDGSGNQVSVNSRLWSFVVENGNTVITIEDASLNGATLTIQGVKGYWPLSLKLVILPAATLGLDDVIITNAALDKATKTLTAAYSSSEYEGHNLSVAIPSINATAMNVEVKDSNNQVIGSNNGRFEISTSADGGITITIVDATLNGATIALSGVTGYYPITFSVVIAQDQEVVVNDGISNGSYDADSKTFTAEYKNSEYNDHHMLFSLKDIVLDEQNIVITNSKGEIVELSSDFWSFWISENNTVFEIKDTSLNDATIQIKDAKGYWPVTFMIAIPQD